MKAANIALLLGAGVLACGLGQSNLACHPCSTSFLPWLSAAHPSAIPFCSQKSPPADVFKENFSKADLATIYGKIQVVDSFPDYKVKVVEAFPDLKVQIVDAFPNSPGKWQYVEALPDFKIRFVESFPDFSVQFVTAFPGVP